MPVRIVRLFNTVGPRQVGQWGMVVPRFVQAALANEPLKVYGTGLQSRCFCHVTDAVGGMMKVIDSDTSVGQVYNVGNNSELSILDLAKRVIEVTGSKSSIEMVDYAKAYGAGFEDMERRVPDISKMKREMDWAPVLGLDAIIGDIAAHMRGSGK